MFVGIVVAAGAVYFDDVLFALVALVGVGVMILYALKTPDIVKYTISKKGVQIGSRLYPFDNIDSFYIHELDEPVIVLHTNRSFMPILTIPIIGIESAHVHDILSYYVPEEHTAIPTSEHISKAIGF